MQEHSLATLKLQIENLLHLHKQLQQENHSLRNRVAKLIQERAILTNIKDRFRKEIKNIVSLIKKDYL